MLSDKLSEPAASVLATSVSPVQSQTGVDEWGDFSGPPAATQDKAKPVANPVLPSNFDDWGDFSSQLAASVESVAVSVPAVVQPRTSVDEWGDFNG
jgi:hypothetical protein